ncbi:cell envelope integrity protein TolA [uncultured Marinobacter sp.]|uniref:cell envelope integrity protein TolA n=1 Tax=uncultured Marinobacter sp. TaxID=187379 RepID=UPI00262E766E|nr:cell envelope integrity protein TolA [uncultured Marinobacter sp.]
MVVTGQEREYTSTGVPPWKSPVALSVALHLLIAGVALAGWSWSNPIQEPPPSSISARLITQQKPEPSPVVEPVDQPDKELERKELEKQKQAELQQRQKEEEARKAAEQKKREEAKRKAEEQERKREQAKAEELKVQKQREAARQKAEAEAKERERRKAEADAEKKRQEEAKRKAEEERQRKEEQRKREEAERKKQEELARKEAERKRLEAERKLQERQLEAQAEQARKARADEARRQEQAAAAKARESQMLSESQKYQALIRERLSQAWYPPSSATEDMTARLQITLLPTGELASVKLVASSGNTAFDNSALGAVKSLSRYPVPSERDTFETYFRQFTIEFNPKRLR